MASGKLVFIHPHPIFLYCCRGKLLIVLFFIVYLDQYLIEWWFTSYSLHYSLNCSCIVLKLEAYLSNRFWDYIVCQLPFFFHTRFMIIKSVSRGFYSCCWYVQKKWTRGFCFVCFIERIRSDSKWFGRNLKCQCFSFLQSRLSSTESFFFFLDLHCHQTSNVQASKLLM